DCQGSKYMRFTKHPFGAAPDNFSLSFYFLPLFARLSFGSYPQMPRVCPAYTSVKTLKSGTIANRERRHSGRKAHGAGCRMSHGSHENDTGDRPGGRCD